MRRFRIAALALCLAPVLSARAQDKSSIDLRAMVGARNAIIEGTCSHGEGQLMGGASIRYHATPRVSFGPEFLFIGACDQQTFTFFHPQMSGMMDVAFDLGKGRRLRPYFIAGGGFVRHRSLGGRAPLYRAEGWAGLGTKIFVSDRLFVAPEIQAGGGLASARFTTSLGLLLR